MIFEKKMKYGIDNPANGKYNYLTVKMVKAISNYIKSNEHIYKYYNFSCSKQQHSLDLILYECIRRVTYGSTYRSSFLLPKSTFHDAYTKLIKRNILKNTYVELLHFYFKKSPSRKLMYRFKDTTCIVNKNGSDNVKYNKYKKRKVTKVSLETDAKGVVIHSSINDGTDHDCKVFETDMNVKHLIDDELLKKYSKYYCADSGYDTIFISNYLKENNIIPLIPMNRRKTKDINIIKSRKFSQYHNSIYAKRFNIESTNAYIKSFKLIQTRMDRTSFIFYGSLIISFMGKLLHNL